MTEKTQNASLLENSTSREGNTFFSCNFQDILNVITPIYEKNFRSKLYYLIFLLNTEKMVKISVKLPENGPKSLAASVLREP